MPCIHGLDEINCPMCRLTRASLPNSTLNIKSEQNDFLKPEPFDPNVILVDTSRGNNGVTTGPDGFVAAVNASEPGLLKTTGFDVTGKGPGTDMHILSVYWSAENAGTTLVEIIVNSLIDSSYADIGVPAGRTVIIDVVLE